MTPRMSSPKRIGNANAPCKPALSAIGPRRNVGSADTLESHIGSPSFHTRLIRPPGLVWAARGRLLEARKSAIAGDGKLQVAVTTRPSVLSSLSQQAPHAQPRVS